MSNMHLGMFAIVWLLYGLANMLYFIIYYFRWNVDRYIEVCFEFPKIPIHLLLGPLYTITLLAVNLVEIVTNDRNNCKPG